MTCVRSVAIEIGTTAHLSCSYSSSSSSSDWTVSWYAIRGSASGSSSLVEIIRCGRGCSFLRAVKYGLNVTRETGDITLAVFDTETTDSLNYTCIVTGEGIQSAIIELGVEECLTTVPTLVCPASIAVERVYNATCYHGYRGLEEPLGSMQYSVTAQQPLLQLDQRLLFSSHGVFLNASLIMAEDVSPELRLVCCADTTNDRTVCDTTLCSETCHVPVLTLPNAPAEVWVNSFSPTTLDVEWTPSRGGGLPVNYTVSCCTVGLSMSELCHKWSNVLDSHFLTRGLASFTRYRITVQAGNELGSSLETTFYTYTAPLSPDAMGITASYNMESGQLALSQSVDESIPDNLCLYLEFRIAGVQHRNDSCLRVGQELELEYGAKGKQLWIVACGQGLCGTASPVIIPTTEALITQTTMTREESYILEGTDQTFVIVTSSSAAAGFVLFCAVCLIVACSVRTVRKKRRPHQPVQRSLPAIPVPAVPSPMDSSPSTSDDIVEYHVIQDTDEMGEMSSKLSINIPRCQPLLGPVVPANQSGFADAPPSMECVSVEQEVATEVSAKGLETYNTEIIKLVHTYHSRDTDDDTGDGDYYDDVESNYEPINKTLKKEYYTEGKKEILDIASSIGDPDYLEPI